jgi:hypothetical protein
MKTKKQEIESAELLKMAKQKDEGKVLVRLNDKYKTVLITKPKNDTEEYKNKYMSRVDIVDLRGRSNKRQSVEEVLGKEDGK